MRARPFSLDGMAIGCVVVAGLIEAAQQALNSSPDIIKTLPKFFSSGRWNYVPLGLISIAAFLWVLNQGRRLKVVNAG